MIWGLAIEPGQMYSCTLEEEVHLSLAALESRPETDEKTSKYSQVVLKTKDSQQLLCTLVQGTIFQQSLDLKLMPRESVSFSVQGSGVVYITGYSYSSPVDGEGEEDSGEFNTSQELQEGTEVELQEDEERYDDEEISMDIQIKGEPVSTPQEELYEKGEHSISDAGNTIEQNASVPENRLMDVPVPEEATQLGNKHTVAGLDDLEEPNLPQTSDSGWLNETSYPTQVGVSDRPAERTTSHNPSPAGNERSFNEVPGTSRSGWVNSRMTSYPQQGEQVYSQPARNLGGQRSATMPRGAMSRGHQAVYSKPLPRLSKHRWAMPRTVSQEEDILQDNQQMQCRFCRSVFPNYDMKKCHEKTHTEARAYRCLYCVKSFKSHGHREQHERIHTGVKPFKCRICTKGFAQSGDRNRHERIHSANKPYQCRHCKKFFKDYSYAMRHERTQHRGITTVGGEDRAENISIELTGYDDNSGSDLMLLRDHNVGEDGEDS